MIKFRVNLAPINVERQPSPVGRGCPATALSPAAAGRVRGHFVATGNCFPHFMQKPLGILYHQPIRNAQQPDPRSSQIVFFRCILPHLAGLRVSTTVKFDRQAMLEAIEIDNPVFDSALAAELCTQLAVAQEIPRRSFGLGLVVPKFANALGWDAHGASIAGLRERG